MRRVDTALLAGVGTLTVHQVAYALAAAFEYGNEVGHGHLATAWILGSLAAIGTLVTSVARSLRSRRHEPLSLPLLTMMIGGGYVLMEGVERWLDGSSPILLLSELVFWLGLVGSPLVAVAFRWSLRVASEVASRLFDATSQSTWPRSVPNDMRSTSVELLPLVVRSHSVSRRGPPVR